MKIKGYTLEIDGELAPVWFDTDRKVLRHEAYGLLPPYGCAKIVPVNVTMTKRRKRKS